MCGLPLACTFQLASQVSGPNRGGLLRIATQRDIAPDSPGCGSAAN